MTLNRAFNSGPNSLNFVRLVLAGLVIVSHSWILGGYGEEPRLGGVTLGGWALFGFFGLSGYLITRSRLSGKPASNFYWARFLRIFPAYLVCLLVVAFAFAPLSTLLGDGEYLVPSAMGFVVRNFLLYPPVLAQPGIAETLIHVPFDGYWDGPLWTLFFEAIAYVMIGLMASLLSRRVLPLGVASVFVATTALSLLDTFDFLSLNSNIATWIPLFTAFAAGSLLYLYGRKIPIGWRSALVAFALLLAVSAAGLAPQLGCLTLAYLLICVGIALPLHKIGGTYDISYGMYIYGWPVQQLLVLIFSDRLPVPLFVLSSLAATAVAAALSCLLVEKPTLKYKNWSRRSPVAAI